MSATLTTAVAPPPAVPTFYGDQRLLVQEARVQYPSAVEFPADRFAAAVACWRAEGSARADLIATCELEAEVDDAPTQLMSRWNPDRGGWSPWKDRTGGLFEAVNRAYGEPVG